MVIDGGNLRDQAGGGGEHLVMKTWSDEGITLVTDWLNYIYMTIRNGRPMALKSK